MKRKLLVCVLLIAFTLNLAQNTEALTRKGKFDAKVTAKVGEFYLNLSGFVSPFASVVLSSDGIFMRATVADEKGNFYISSVLIKKGFSHFCLEAVDFKRIGESYTCINIPPATGSVTKDKIFLPPTLGLSKNVAYEGEEVLAFGYTMPNARVNLDIGGRIETVLADSSGYYIFRLKNLPAGTYQLFATARFQELDSLSPSKKVELRTLSLWERIIEFIKELLRKIVTLLTSLILNPLWLTIPLIILIIILIRKLWPRQTRLWPGKFTSIGHRFVIPFGERKEKLHLHHYWLFGE